MDAVRFFIGNQSSPWAQPTLLPFEFARWHGFEAFEWFSDKGRGGWGEEDLDAAERRRLRDLGRECGIRFSIHAPWAANPLTLQGAAAIRTSLDCASDLGAAVVNIHLFPERGAQAFAEALHPLLVQARAAGVRLSVENTPETTPNDFNFLFAALAQVAEARGRVGMCLDMGHANLCPATRHDYVGYVDQLGLHVPIIHWHAHENWGDRDSHLPLFTGPSAQSDAGVRALVQRLRQRGFHGSVVLEQWPNPPDLLLQVRDRLRAIVAR